VVVRLGQTRDKSKAGEMLPKEIYRYVDAAVEAARQSAAATPTPAG